MENIMPPRHMLPPDQGPNPQLVKKIVKELKINGVFDEMRKECLADIDTKPAFSNLKQRVEGHVKGILANQHWSPSLNKNQLRSMIRESVMQSGILNEGVDRILYQVFSSKACPVFLPKIKEFVKERGEELMKEFLPPPMEITPVMMNPLPFEHPPIPISPEVEPELFPPPMPPSQPPPPDSPTIPGSDDHFNGEEGSVENSTVQVETIHEVSEEILTYKDQEFYVKDVAPEDVVVKAINTPSPHPSTPESADENAPKIPQEAVNPLRSLIQSLLVSKQTILETTENENQEPECEKKAVQKGKVKVEGYSPVIDPSQIEGFTDDEEEVEEYIPAPGPKTPTDEEDAYEPLEPTTTQEPPTSHDEQTSLQSDPRTPSGVYSPLSPGQVFDDSRGNAETISEVEIEKDRKSDSDSRMTDERSSTPAYDPSKFSYQQMSDSTPLNEDDNDQSPPSPTEITDATEKNQYTDETVRYRSEGNRYGSDMKENKAEQNFQQSQKSKKKRRSSSDSSESSSSSGSVSSSRSSRDENDQTIVVQEQVVEQEVEEMVEEIEVVEEFTSGGSAEEGEQLESESEEEEEQQVQQRQVVKSHKDKKRKKKTKKKKAKKPKKRVRTSSISSGEITSSCESSSDSSSGSNRPTRPTQPPRKKSLDLGELEERRRILREESMHDRSYWANTASSSEYQSSPGRIPRPYSPRRPYSPDFHRYKDDLGYGPPPVPHFRDRPMFPGDYHPRHARLSPPPYRRSPPHRYSPGLRMDFPRMPFGSSRSPPRRPYSPPRMMGGYPRERPPFPHPHHRWRSPPRPGPRRPSRSPPPVLRRDDGPRPSRY